MNRKDFILLFTSAVCLIVSWPPFPTGFLSTVALIPLFIFIQGKDLKQAVTGGLFTGILVAAGTVYWLSWATVPGFAGSLLVVAPYYGLFLFLLAFLHRLWGERALFFAPFLWTSIELFSTLGELAFPWNLLGYSFSSYPELIQYASFSGVFGVSFWIVLMNVLIYFLFQSSKLKFRIIYASLIILLLSVTWISGYITISQGVPPERSVRVSIIQGNIDPYQEWTSSFIDTNFAIYNRLTRSTASFQPDIIVWPETAAPCFLRYRSRYAQPIRNQLRTLNASLVTGSADYNYNTKEQFNCSFLVRHDTYQLPSYYKRHLVPFSERVPLSGVFPGAFKLTRKIFLTVGNFAAGDSAVVFTAFAPSLNDSIRFSPVICFDSVFPFIVSDAVKAGSHFLIVQTNDGWFGKTSGPYQHAQLAVFRSIENRIWLARSANTGISEFIDPFGRIIKPTSLDERTVINHLVGLRESDSFFTKHGQAVAWFFVLTTLAVLTAAGLIAMRTYHAVDSFCIRGVNGTVDN